MERRAREPVWGPDSDAPTPVSDTVLMFVRSLAEPGGAEKVRLSARILRGVLARMDRGDGSLELVDMLAQLTEPGVDPEDDTATLRDLIAWARRIKGTGPRAVCEACDNTGHVSGYGHSVEPCPCTACEGTST